MRSHIRKFHDTECDADTLHKYTKIARRLQDLRKIKCVYCEKFFRVVSLRVHMRKCRATPEVNTEKVVRSLRGGDTAEENSSSLSDKAHEAKMRKNVEPQVICEAIFAKFRVKVAHKAGEYTVTCEICEGNFSLQLINMHIKVNVFEVIEKIATTCPRIATSLIYKNIFENDQVSCSDSCIMYCCF